MGEGKLKKHCLGSIFKIQFRSLRCDLFLMTKSSVSVYCAHELERAHQPSSKSPFFLFSDKAPVQPCPWCNFRPSSCPFCPKAHSTVPKLLASFFHTRPDQLLNAGLKKKISFLFYTVYINY